MRKWINILDNVCEMFKSLVLEIIENRLIKYFLIYDIYRELDIIIIILLEEYE